MVDLLLPVIRREIYLFNLQKAPGQATALQVEGLEVSDVCVGV